MKAKIIKKWEKFTLSITCYLLTFWGSTYFALCDIFADVATVSKNTQAKLIDTATALLPLIAIIDILAIVFTRDQRKLAVEIALLVGSVVGFIAILIIGKGELAATLKSLIGM